MAALAATLTQSLLGLHALMTLHPNEGDVMVVF